MAITLPSLCMPEERERVIRRLHHNAKARERAKKLQGTVNAQCDHLKQTFLKEHQEFIQELLDTQRQRVGRWSEKMQGSPLSVDQWAEDQRIFELNRIRDKQEQQKRKLMERRLREAHNTIVQRATAERDELEELRTERRLLVENKKQLKALKDVERTNLRALKVLEDRKKAELDRQQSQLERAMSSPSFF